MQLNTLGKINTVGRRKRIGRGGKRGTYSGKGTKGQKARAGHRMRPQLRDELKKLPKRRGYGINRADSVRSDRTKYTVVQLETLAAISDGKEITPKVLFEKQVISKKQRRSAPVKVLGGGSLKKKIALSGMQVSASARKAIEAAGGTVQTK